MKRVLFDAEISSESGLDEAFKPVQKAVTAAYKKGEMGAVLCQIIKNSDGTYRVTGAFYPEEKALIINEALKEASKSDA